MNFPQNIFRKIYQASFFIAAFLLVAASLQAFPGEYGDEIEKRNEQQQQAEWQIERDATQGNEGNELLQEAGTTINFEHDDGELIKAEEEVTIWEWDKSFISGLALNSRIRRLQEKAEEYTDAADNHSTENADAAERIADNLNRINNLLERANVLKANLEKETSVFQTTKFGSSTMNNALRGRLEAAQEVKQKKVRKKYNKEMRLRDERDAQTAGEYYAQLGWRLLLASGAFLMNVFRSMMNVILK